MGSRLAAATPGRFGEPAEIADAVFLTAGNTDMTASERLIDGGSAQV